MKLQVMKREREKRCVNIHVHACTFIYTCTLYMYSTVLMYSRLCACVHDCAYTVHVCAYPCVIVYVYMYIGIVCHYEMINEYRRKINVSLGLLVC